MPHINWLKLLYWLTMSGLIGLGLLFVGLGGEVNHLSCLRRNDNQVNCTLERRFLGVMLVTTQPLMGVTTAVVQEDCQDGCVYWVALDSEHGPVRLTRFASYNRFGVTADQQRITAFLQGAGLSQFEHRGSVSWVLLLCSLPLFGAAAFLWRWR